jgi:hypothetical protein
MIQQRIREHHAHNPNGVVWLVLSRLIVGSASRDFLHRLPSAMEEGAGSTKVVDRRLGAAGSDYVARCSVPKGDGRYAGIQQRFDSLSNTSSLAWHFAGNYHLYD